ncbi:hypothetical protein [Flavobacterium hungaricum]|uniref:Immunity protein 35 n=1 Tax=Flavobacterium hungaricum TaxID=2082725 RepID=A0ABR9THA2_9FLAO|nr:hypothetical protein [Flavobacterium hungaricum]MBE8724725.1 hypothetical protein [Flavobacterium hungaricum]
MDLEKVKQIIDEKLGSEYVVFETEDSEKYTFAYYKHRDYGLEDDRGRLVGTGPVVFVKETGEHKLLSSGDCIYGDYFDFREEVEEEPFVLPSLEQIKESILRRNFVNSEDLFFLEENWKQQFEDPSMALTGKKDMDFTNFLLVKSKNSSFLDFIKEYWLGLDLDFEMLDDEQLMLRRVNPKLEENNN